MKKVAIISSYNVACGIAYNSAIIKQQLDKYYQVDVLAVDMQLTRFLYSKKLSLLAEKHIDEICQQLNEYDYINIQLETGIFGATYYHSLPRIARIINASNKPIILTMHCNFIGKKPKYLGFIKDLIQLDFKSFYDRIIQILTYREVIKFWDLIQEKSKNNVSLIVYSEDQQVFLKQFMNITNTYVHPLCYFDKNSKQNIKNNLTRDQFNQQYNIRPDEKILGIFGFISPYKGTNEVVNALKFLPKNFKLIIFGGLNIAGDTTVSNQYLREIIDIILGYGLEDRVIMLGAVSDDEMASGMANIDIAIFPYLDTKQVASGPATMGIELAPKMIATATHVFKYSYQKYYPTQITFYESGNYLELAQKIIELAARTTRFNSDENLYNIESQIELYKKIWEKDNI